MKMSTNIVGLIQPEKWAGQMGTMLTNSNMKSYGDDVGAHDDGDDDDGKYDDCMWW